MNSILTSSLILHQQPLPVMEVKESDTVLMHETTKQDLYGQDPSMLEVQRLTYTSEKFWKKEYVMFAK